MSTTRVEALSAFDSLTLPSNRSHAVRLLLTVLSALFLRMIVVALVFRDVAAPTIDHEQFGWEMGWTARSIALGRGFSSPFLPWTGPTAFVPPLYPYLLALVFRIFGVYTATSALVTLSLNSLFSALTCIPIYFSARNAIGNRAAKLTAWAWAIYPFAIYFSADRVWDYGLSCLLFTTCFWIAQHLGHQRHPLVWLGFGILYGITALSNPSVLLMFPIFLLFAVLAVRRRKEKWISHSIIAVLGLIAVVTPWTIRNYRVLHILAPVRDNFWLECWAGNNGNTFESNDHTARPPSNPIELLKFQSVGEVPYLTQTRGLAIDFITRHPFLFIKFTLHRILCYWTGYWSFNPAYLHAEPTEIPNIIFSVALLLFMLRGARRLWLQDKTAVLPYIFLFAIFPISYYLAHVKPDFRHAIEPEILTLVTIGIFGLANQDDSFPVYEVSLDDQVLVGV